jgi:hypothetical protein
MTFRSIGFVLGALFVAGCGGVSAEDVEGESAEELRSTYAPMALTCEFYENHRYTQGGYDPIGMMGEDDQWFATAEGCLNPGEVFRIAIPEPAAFRIALRAHVMSSCKGRRCVDQLSNIQGVIIDPLGAEYVGGAYAWVDGYQVTSSNSCTDNVDYRPSTFTPDKMVCAIEQEKMEQYYRFEVRNLGASTVCGLKFQVQANTTDFCQANCELGEFAPRMNCY